MEKEKKLKALRLAAEKGDPHSQYLLALEYFTGSVVQKTKTEYRKWFQLAAEQGNRDATFFLGYNAYKNGNFVEALKWLKLTAEQGDVKAQHLVGIIYVEGKGVDRDIEEGLIWLGMAADNDHPYAQSMLGIISCGGEKMQADYEQGIKWFRKAAEQGDEVAQYNLGLMYFWGLGTAKSYEDAYSWMLLAGENGSQSALEDLKKLEEEMTIEDIERGANLAANISDEIFNKNKVVRITVPPYKD
jgi:hypothetical protein